MNDLINGYIEHRTNTDDCYVYNSLSAHTLPLFFLSVQALSSALPCVDYVCRESLISCSKSVSIAVSYEYTATPALLFVQEPGLNVSRGGCREKGNMSHLILPPESVFGDRYGRVDRR